MTYQLHTQTHTMDKDAILAGILVLGVISLVFLSKTVEITPHRITINQATILK